jgi:D-glycero-D-manno-heptose 1,7-bisphosphate phosphatase
MQVKIPFSWPNFKFNHEWSLFLDRDGVINERLPDDYVKKWEDFKFLPGVLDALTAFNQYFSRIFIVTNQAGIEKELYTHQDLKQIHEQMMEYIQYHGGRIDEIYYCPYKGDLDPLCRKPNPGMALEAKKDFPEIDFKQCIMVGDSASDIAFGNNLGMKTILVGHKGDQSAAYANAIPDCRLDSLKDFGDYVAAME